MAALAALPRQLHSWTVVDASPFKDAFHVWHAVGTADVRYAQTHNQGMAMMQLPEFGPSTYSYHERPGGQHDMYSVWEFCYNALPVFFPLGNTGVSAPRIEQPRRAASEAIYTIDGRYVSRLQHGIYIVNGKKMKL